MRIAGVVPDSVVDGPGLRFTVFAQGCRIRCPGCHNPGTHDPLGGWEVDWRSLAAQMCADSLTTGLTLSGGEVSEQPAEAAELARAAHQSGRDVWAWSGYRVEALARRAGTNKSLARLLGELDVLVDGPFLLARRTLSLPWRGSDNQRLIDVPATRRAGKVIVWEHSGQNSSASTVM